MNKARILIVDDKEENVYLMRMLLEGNGFEVEEASNGAEALEKAKANPPALIISDILMPVMDGFALCREWKKDGKLKPIPFAYYTATYTEDRDQDFALSLGAERFIVKPQEPEAMLEIIRDVIGKSKVQETVDDKKTNAREIEQASEVHGDDSVYLKQYNETLVRKLITKMEELEKANRQLENDISARKMIEAALRESEECFRSLVEVAPDAIFVQRNGIFLFVNTAALKLFGASGADELLGTEIMMRIAPEWRDNVRERVRFQQETGKPAPLMEQDYLRLDGSKVPVETTAVQVKYKGNNAHLVFVRDITERKKAEEEKSKLEAQLRQAQKMEAIGQLAGGVAHDFNNLLQVINGYTQLMLVTSTSDSSVRNQLKEVKKAGEGAAKLIRQLLAFSRKQVQQPLVLNINAIVADMEKMLRRLIPKNIVLKAEPCPDLGMIKADPGQIEQVIMNLVVNARDAMAGNGHLSISTSNVEVDKNYAKCRTEEIKPGYYVMIEVRDNGCGMDDKVKSHIFEPFFTTKAEGYGTGLGLATVYGIVKQSGGFIDVESEVDKGTAFKIYFPQHLQKDLRNESKSDDSAMPCGTETILLVEDMDDVRTLVTAMLHSLGYSVIAASHGIEALELAGHHSQPIQLLITDLIMPGMNGIELSKRMSKICPAIKTLFISGYLDEMTMRDEIKEAYIHKPITLGDLSHKLREVLDRK